MRIHDVLHKTKQGHDITFKKVEDSEGDKNRGWQVDEITAYVDEKVAGYIKISYIPHIRMEKHFPTIYNWLSSIGGTLLLPFDKRSYHYKDLTKDERRKMLKDVVFNKNFIPYGEEKAFVESLNDREVLEKLQEFEKKLDEGGDGVRFRQFKNFHKDKPLVDYIRVEPNFKRLGIGTALYLEGAKWMKEKGMKLYASSVQTDEAKKVWEHLGKTYKVKSARNRKRKYLEI